MLDVFKKVNKILLGTIQKEGENLGTLLFLSI